MDEPFYYLSAEDVVPRDAAHVVIGGSVRVVPPRTFNGYENLARVELREGVEVIGARAFRDCPNLTHVSCPSSLRTIDDEAFQGCCRLIGLILQEGLRKIGMRAFKSCCKLETIAVPSSVVEIGRAAFALCQALTDLILREGLRRIGKYAFVKCTSLRRIILPSSVVEIGERAFFSCDNLEAATLAGEMVMLLTRAPFFRCPRLERIAISSMAIVVRAERVRAGKGGRVRVATVIGGIKRDPAKDFRQLILGSSHLELMSPEDLMNLTDGIDRIVNHSGWIWPYGSRLFEDVSDQVRDCFVNHLSTWYDGYYKREVATILELGLWKIELGRAREAGRSRAAGGGETSEVNVPTRDDCRRTCGADPIVALVLSSLAGPHRRGDRAENA